MATDDGKAFTHAEITEASKLYHDMLQILKDAKTDGGVAMLAIATLAVTGITNAAPGSEIDIRDWLFAEIGSKVDMIVTHARTVQ
jgi:hypothetical protein